LTDCRFDSKDKMPERYQRMSFVCSTAPEAQEALALLTHRYGNAPPQEADVIVVLGGDGMMLQSLHRFMDDNVPLFGLHRGSVGFLMNQFHKDDDLIERLALAEKTVIHPLLMKVHDASGVHHMARAINEVSLFRQTHQAAKIRISVDGKERLSELVADGVLVATPAGSTAYNFSAHGPIIPLGGSLLALTPMSPFRPRRWRGALLPDRAEVVFDVLETQKRPVAAVADHTELRNVVQVRVSLERERCMTMLHDSDHRLDERIIAEQFTY
jgi:NAD+ kinase